MIDLYSHTPPAVYVGASHFCSFVKNFSLKPKVNCNKGKKMEKNCIID